MEEPIIEAKGIDCDVKLYSNRIEYTRKGAGGLFLHGLDGTKIIFIRSITGIQFLKDSYIQFIFMGSQENKAGIFSALKDENTIFFKKKQSKDFEDIKNYIIEHI